MAISQSVSQPTLGTSHSRPETSSAKTRPIRKRAGSPVAANEAAAGLLQQNSACNGGYASVGQRDGQQFRRRPSATNCGDAHERSDSASNFGNWPAVGDFGQSRFDSFGGGLEVQSSFSTRRERQAPKCFVPTDQRRPRRNHSGAVCAGDAEIG